MTFFTHPLSLGRGLFQNTIQQMLSELTSHAEAPEWVYISVLADDEATQRVIEKCGFQYFESVVKRTMFFRIIWEVGPI